MSFRYRDESPRGSMAFQFHDQAANQQQQHLRRRSSVTASNLSSPFISNLVYDERTGEIQLPPSPPLPVWKEKNALGLYDDASSGKARLPPYRPKGSAYTIPRPWIQVMSLGCMTLSFITLITYLVPPSSSYSSTSIMNRIRLGSTCEPYSSFGSLTVDTSDPDKNQWVPFDPQCSPPSFLAKLRQDDPNTDFSWLHNRTALIIGDAISREHVENFCQLMGEESEVVRATHKWAAAAKPMRAATKAGHSLERPKRLSGRGYRVVRDASRPRICYIPKYDFLLVSVFHFGLDQEDYWRESRMPQYTSPGMFEHRLTDIVDPLITAMRADGRRSAPDFVEVTSGVWDLARWAEQDLTGQQETTTGLAQDRVTWYRFRVGQVLEKVRKMFPEAKVKTWRTMHYPTDQVAEYDYFMDKISARANSSESMEPPHFSHNRIYQLDQAVRTLLLPTTVGDHTEPAPHADYRLNEWGPVLKGQEAHQKDRLHGDPLPGGYVWGDIMLYELWRGVRRAEQAPLRSWRGN